MCELLSNAFKVCIQIVSYSDYLGQVLPTHRRLPLSLFKLMGEQRASLLKHLEGA